MLMRHINTQKVFLTGGTGFIGSNFLKYLLGKDLQVVAIKRSSSSPRIKIAKESVWINGELSDDWSETLKECTSLIHFASCGVTKNSEDWEKCFQVNVIDSVNLWTQAIKAGVKKFIIIGSCFEYGLSGENYDYIPTSAELKPTNAYGSSKACASIIAQELCQQYSLEVIILRPFHVYGNGEDKKRFWPGLVESAQNNKDFKMTKGEQIRDFQLVEETAKQIYEFSFNQEVNAGRPLLANLGSGKPLKLIDFAKREWAKYNPNSSIIPGVIPYRTSEIMRYVPDLNFSL